MAFDNMSNSELAAANEAALLFAAHAVCGRDIRDVIQLARFEELTGDIGASIDSYRCALIMWIPEGRAQ